MKMIERHIRATTAAKSEDVLKSLKVNDILKVPGFLPNIRVGKVSHEEGDVYIWADGGSYLWFDRLSKKFLFETEGCDGPLVRVVDSFFVMAR
jgi:hypothetical protein